MVDLKKRLELTVMPTERCNFRCVYCYEDFKIGRMKPWVREGIKQLISKRVERYGLDYLELGWFGGEPLLAKDVVFDITAHAANLLQAGAIGAMGGEMTTNGYLLDRATLTTLVELGQKHYQITLDGDEPEHNQTRRSASGVPTFETIWSNLVAAHASDLDFSITLRLHIMPGNAESLSRLVDRLIGTFEGDPRFSFLIREISNLGGPTSGTVAYISAQEARAIADQLVHRFAAHDIRARNGVAALFESQVDVHDIPKPALIQLRRQRRTSAMRPSRTTSSSGPLARSSSVRSISIRIGTRSANCMPMARSRWTAPRWTIGRGAINLDQRGSPPGSAGEAVEV